MKYLVYILFVSCSYDLAAQQKLPSDKKATAETVNLYNNLHKLAKKGFMFGHQDALAYGVNWKYEDGRSDVKDVTGDYPAVYGWDIGGIERNNSKENLDGVPFTRMKEYITQGYARGGLITLSWHVDSPSGSGNGSWDTTRGLVASILPGGKHHTLYRTWLDKAAAFIGSLKGPAGESIPILFRPFHEHTGGWFWWGQNRARPEEYKALWRFTMQYLHNDKRLHNILWVYNTGGDFHTRDEYLERYPGDDAVDMLSFDTYQNGNPESDKSFETSTQKRLALVSSIAKEKNKLVALAETGFEAIPYPKWWTTTLINAIGDNPVSYVLLWRNHGYHEDMKKMHYYVPFKGHASGTDFVNFYKLEKTLFGRDAEDAKLYKQDSLD